MSVALSPMMSANMMKAGMAEKGFAGKINRDLGITIIIIEHFMKVLTELTEKLLIIESGRMICCDEPAKVANDPKVIECYLGDR